MYKNTNTIRVNEDIIGRASTLNEDIYSDELLTDFEYPDDPFYDSLRNKPNVPLTEFIVNMIELRLYGSKLNDQEITVVYMKAMNRDVSHREIARELGVNRQTALEILADIKIKCPYMRHVMSSGARKPNKIVDKDTIDK